MLERFILTGVRVLLKNLATFTDGAALRGVTKQKNFMKKIVASVGLVALGATGLYSAPIAGLTEEGGKNWSVSATLRGFYDDNLNTISGPGKQSAFGVEISPSATAAFRWPQTTLSLGYVFS